jgi:hypothetical protein
MTRMFYARLRFVVGIVYKWLWIPCRKVVGLFVYLWLNVDLSKVSGRCLLSCLKEVSEVTWD